MIQFTSQSHKAQHEKSITKQLTLLKYSDMRLPDTPENTIETFSHMLAKLIQPSIYQELFYNIDWKLPGQ